jgi:hypothetical protein
MFSVNYFAERIKAANSNGLGCATRAGQLLKHASLTDEELVQIGKCPGFHNRPHCLLACLRPPLQSVSCDVNV